MLTARFKPQDELPPLPQGGHWEICQYHTPQRVYFSPNVGKTPYACVDWSNVQQGELTCWYLSGKESYMSYSRNVGELLSLETLMLQQSGFLLHASFVRWQGKGILFSAPSGTGKSTQAELWRQYQDAEIINGDRVGLRKYNHIWRAYGLPFAGSSGIFRNESAEIAAIIILGQSQHNTICRLGTREAFFHLYPEITLHHWDSNFVEQGLTLLNVLMEDIPIFYLSCRPDRDAVILTRDTVFQKGGSS